MNKKRLGEIIGASYKSLDKKRVNKIASLLNVKDFKAYVNGLKSAEKANTLTISSATPLNQQDLKKITKLFPEKKIILEKDPSLMLGVRITDNDLIYDFTLKDSLHRALSYVEQNYN